MKKHSKFAITPKSADVSTPDLSDAFQFWSILSFGIPSLICSLFIFYRYLSDPIRRHALYNHPILIILMANTMLILTDFLWTLDSLRRPGHVLSSTPTFCMFWWVLDFNLYNTQTLILAWASIERHILIFHSQLILTRKRKFYYHYLPPIILIIYLTSFYVGVVFFPPCDNEFDFTSVECGSDPCYLNITFLALWDLIVNNAIPTLTIAIFSFALFYRVIAHRKRIRQPIQWRRYRRMAMQLFSLSAVYLFLNFPFTLILIIYLFRSPESQSSLGTQLYIFFLTYSVSLSLPFVVLLNYLSNDKNHNQRISPIHTNSQRQRIPERNIATIE
jgi:hypothetical protein